MILCIRKCSCVCPRMIACVFTCFYAHVCVSIGRKRTKKEKIRDRGMKEVKIKKCEKRRVPPPSSIQRAYFFARRECRVSRPASIYARQVECEKLIAVRCVFDSGALFPLDVGILDPVPFIRGCAAVMTFMYVFRTLFLSS